MYIFKSGIWNWKIQTFSVSFINCRFQARVSLLLPISALTHTYMRHIGPAVDACVCIRKMGPLQTLCNTYQTSIMLTPTDFLLKFNCIYSFCLVSFSQNTSWNIISKTRQCMHRIIHKLRTWMIVRDRPFLS